MKPQYFKSTKRVSRKDKRYWGCYCKGAIFVRKGRWWYLLYKDCNDGKGMEKVDYCGTISKEDLEDWNQYPFSLKEIEESEVFLENI